MQTAETELVLTVIFHPSSPLDVVPPGIAPTHLVFNFHLIIKITISSCGNSDIDVCSDRKPSDLEYVDSVLLLNGDPRFCYSSGLKCGYVWYVFSTIEV